MQIREHVPLSSLTTFGIGGAARYFAEIKTEEDLREALRWAKEKNITSYVLGGGSNMLISDEGFDGLILHIVSKQYSFAGTELSADAGCNLYDLIRTAAKHNLSGAEKLAGIPGTLGGAVRGNAGAFGVEIKDQVTRVKATHRETGEVRNFINAQCVFSYRHSYFKDHPEWIITHVRLELTRANAETSKKMIEETIRERERRHLQNVRAAGSFFMNPTVSDSILARFETDKGMRARESRVPAGWLIEMAGLKGYRFGDAIASEQHPNYLTNLGNASASDVLELARRIKYEVANGFGVLLQEEASVL